MNPAPAPQPLPAKVLPVERGSIYWVALDPIQGAEIAKTRPCIVMSASEINLHRKTVVVVPLTTTSLAAVPPLLVAMPSAGVSSKARVEQIRAVDKTRLQRKIGRLGAPDLQTLELALRQVLRLPKD
jgi:mRNA interferase MazF